MTERRRLGVFDMRFDNKISATVEYMERNGLQFKGILGTGSFGCVVKMINCKDQSKVAVKIVKKQSDESGEITIWRRLQHKNILKLISYKYISSVDCIIFVTPVLPITLKDKLLEKSSPIKLYLAIRWLENISDAISYLHSQKLWYLDLKPNNVLLSKSQNAVLCDFGFMTVGDKPVNHYGHPRLYGPPEAWNHGVLKNVDGYSFDVWRIGLLAIEIFTCMALLNEANKWSYPFTDWICIVYPMVQSLLVKEQFFKLMKSGFSTSGARSKIDDVLNFIKFCLNVIAEKRPKVERLLSHRLFGGCFENVETQQPEMDVWEKALSTSEIMSIIQNNTLGLVAKSSGEKVVFGDPVLCAPEVIERTSSSLLQSPPLLYENVRIDKESKEGENAVKDEDQTLKIEDETTDVKDSDDFCLDIIFGSAAERSSSWISLVGSDYFSDDENVELREKEMESDEISCFALETLFDDVADKNDRELNTKSFDKESDNSMTSGSKVSSNNSNEDRNDKRNCCQRLRSLWKRGKSICCRIFVCCVPCVKRKQKVKNKNEV